MFKKNLLSGSSRFSMLFVLLYAASYFVWAVGLNALIKQPVLTMVIVNVIAAAGYFLCRHFDSNDEFSIRSDENKSAFYFSSPLLFVILLLSLTFLLFISAQIFSASMPELITANMQKRENAIMQTGFDSFLYLLLSLVMAPVCEECIFRGMVLPVCSRKLGLAFGVGFSSVVFAAFHGTLIHLFTATVFGILCAYAFYVTDNVFYSIFVHSFYNLLIYIGMLANINVPVVSQLNAIIILAISYLVVITLFVCTKRRFEIHL